MTTFDDRVNNAVALLKGRINPDLPMIAERDRTFLMAVASKLGLDPNSPLQLAHIAALLGVMEVATGEEYPKWIYPDGLDKPGYIVHNADEEALGHPPEHLPLKFDPLNYDQFGQPLVRDSRPIPDGSPINRDGSPLKASGPLLGAVRPTAPAPTTRLEPTVKPAAKAEVPFVDPKRVPLKSPLLK